PRDKSLISTQQPTQRLVGRDSTRLTCYTDYDKSETAKCYYSEQICTHCRDVDICVCESDSSPVSVLRPVSTRGKPAIHSATSNQSMKPRPSDTSRKA